jgi:hypothetical protein
MLLIAGLMIGFMLGFLAASLCVICRGEPKKAGGAVLELVGRGSRALSDSQSGLANRNWQG